MASRPVLACPTLPLETVTLGNGHEAPQPTATLDCMAWIRRLLAAAAVSTALLLSVMSALALQNYWKDSRKPAFDRRRDVLYALERRGSSGAPAPGQTGIGGPADVRGAVLLLHGLAASHEIWDRTLAALPADVDVLVPDLLGFGDSPKPKATYDLDTQLSALDELLARGAFAPDRPLILLGHSMGSIVALAWADAHPDRVSQLVLASLPYYPSRADAERQLSATSWMRRGMITRNPAYQLLCYALHGRSVPFLGILTGWPREVAQDGLEHDWSSVRGSLEHIVLEPDVAGLVDRVQAPITLIHGRDDPVVPFEYLSDLVSKRARLRLIAVEQGGHELPLSHPAKLAEAVAAALSAEPG